MRSSPPNCIQLINITKNQLNSLTGILDHALDDAPEQRSNLVVRLPGVSFNTGKEAPADLCGTGALRQSVGQLFAGDREAHTSSSLRKAADD